MKLSSTIIFMNIFMPRRASSRLASISLPPSTPPVVVMFASPPAISLLLGSSDVLTTEGRL